MWSMKTVPMVWSISCWKMRARKPSAVTRNSRPFRSRALTRTLVWRGDFAVDVGHAQAAFKVGYDFAFVLGDLGVDEDGEFLIFFVIVVVADDDDPVQLVDLDGGQGDPDLVVAAGVPIHGGGLHVLDDLLNFVGDYADALGFLPQVRVRQGDNVVFGHWPLV